MIDPETDLDLDPALVRQKVAEICERNRQQAEDRRRLQLERQAQWELQSEARRRRWEAEERLRQQAEADRVARLAAVVESDRQLDLLAAEAKRAETLTLESAGYHRHDRGPWRKKRQRGACPVSETETAQPTEPPAAKSVDLPALHEAITAASADPATAVAFFDRAQAQGQDVVARFIGVFGGDLMAKNERALLERIEPKDHLRREAISRRIGEIRRELTGSGPCSAIERLIIDRAVICWLSVQEAELGLIEHDNQKWNQVFYQKRFDHAQKRFLGVIKSLDQVRRKTPASHRFNVKVLGDMNVGTTAAPPAAPATASIDLTPNTD